MKTFKGKGIIEGNAEGKVIISKTPFGFFGGVDPRTGIIIDKWHELYGKSIKGKIFVYPEGRGSTVGAAIILELARTGNAPAAIVNARIETITVAGGLLAKKFYNTEIPMVEVSDQKEIFCIKEGCVMQVNGDTGEVRILE